MKQLYLKGTLEAYLQRQDERLTREWIWIGLNRRPDDNLRESAPLKKADGRLCTPSFQIFFLGLDLSEHTPSQVSMRGVAFSTLILLRLNAPMR